MVDHVLLKVESGDSPQETFKVSPATFSDLVDPKNPELLKEMGGLSKIASELNVDAEKGLSDDETDLKHRREIFGANILPAVSSQSFLSLMWDACKDKTLILLFCAAVVSLAIGIYRDVSNPDPNEKKIGWIEGFAIIVAVLIVILVNATNDYQKEKQFRKLNAKKEDRMIKVLRDGEMTEISIFDVVVGDVVSMEPGDVLPADGLVIDSHNLSCDESGATGESDAIKKGRDQNDPFVLSGTKVIEGVGTMLVIAVGPNSFHGKTLIHLQVETALTPLEFKLGKLAETIAKIGGSIALLMFVTLLVKYFIVESSKPDFPNSSKIVDKIIQIVIQSITIVVVAVPEGLPMAVTLALAFATTKMMKDNNLVRVLAACETMGNATTICSDKTGTLTENKMTVVQGTLAEVDFQDESGISQLKEKLNQTLVHLLCDSIAMNSSAFLTTDPVTGERLLTGSKTEVALLKFAEKLGCDFEATRHHGHVYTLFPFSSLKKSMTTIVEIDEKNLRIYSKGASEIVLSYCSSYLDAEGNVNSMTEEERSKVVRKISLLAGESLRTICLAYRNISKDHYLEIENDDAPNFDLTLIGIVGIEDPIRQGVPEAVKACQNAGIFVRMVTGDNILTAQAIARKCGILMKGGLIMEGPRFRKLNDQQLEETIPKLQVLARSSPLDKQILVGKLRQMNEVVAVTGDGTNDGPALKAADVGFSMGITGTEVAKEASSIILMDDNFNSIVKAVVWGRSVNDSVRKFLQFQLTVNVTAVVVSFVSALLDDSDHSVLTAVQLLWVNLIMDTLAALALATGNPDPSLLDRHPEARSQGLITFNMWRLIIGESVFQIIVSLLLVKLGGRIFGIPDTDDGRKILYSMIFNTFVFMQLVNEINCRVLGREYNVFKGILSNYYFLVIMFFTIIAQVLIINFGSDAFSTVPIGWNLWLASLGISLFGFVVAACVKSIPDWRKEQQPERVYLTKERLQWQSAINNVRAELRVFSALRRSKKGSRHASIKLE